MVTGSADLIIGVIKHLPMLEELRLDARSREELERRLGVSSATYYRYINWLNDRGMVEESSEEVALTTFGEVIAGEVIRFERSVLATMQRSERARDLLLEVVRYAPGLEALANGPRGRRDLERRLDVSKTTSYRFSRSFEDLGLIERSEGGYALTTVGEELRDEIAAVQSTVRTAVRLGPALEAVGDTTPAFDLEAFADATVTTAEHGDPHSPMSRCIELLEQTETLRGVYTGAIIPLYISDTGDRIVDGMDTVTVGSPERVADALAEAPGKCLDVCASGHLTIYLHDDLSYGLVILDDRVGIGVLKPDTGRLQMFVDTDATEALEWAEAVFESYKAEAVRMEGFSPWEVRRAAERGSLDVSTFNR